MGHDCCHSHDFDGMNDDYKRRLWVVIALNAVMFVVEIIAGSIAGSQALWADSLDFLADTLTYGISLAVIGMPIRVRSNVALLKGISLSVMGVWVLASTVYQVFVLNVPAAPVMASVAMAALAANALSVLLLVKYKDGDANVRSVWLCSRNDMIGNIAVAAAAFGVWKSDTAWPDLAVAGLMSALFLSSSFRILQQACAERRS